MAKAYLSATPPYVVVEKGDTLSEIAQSYASHIAGSGLYGSGGKINTLVKINDITNANYIVVGQKIKLSGSSTTKKNNTSTAIIKAFGLQSNTDRTMYATWTWSKTNTDNYRVIWQYDTGDGVWFEGSDTTTTDKQNTYSAPQNALKVRFKVLPVSKKRKVNGKETSYWTASWSAIKTYAFKNNPPVAPSFSGSNVKMDGTNKITIEMHNLDTSADGLNASTLQFQIYRNSMKLVHTGKANINSIGYLTYSWQGVAGYKYSIRCRSVRGSLYSDWTDLTDEVWSTPPAPARIIDCYPLGDTSIYLTWAGVSTAVSYTIQYLALPDDASEITLPDGQTYFDVYESDVKTSESVPIVAGEAPPTSKTLGALALGRKYCFRVRSNGNGDGMISAWTATRTITLGTAPGQPTTWSSASKVLVGEELTLYWLHNSEDESDPTQAKVYFDIETPEGTTSYVHTVNYAGNDVVEEEEQPSGGLITNAVNWIKGLFTTSTSTATSGSQSKDDKEPVISQYVIQTTNFPEGARITWCVATKGVSDGFGPNSIVREFNIYDIPEFIVDFKGNTGTPSDEELDFVCYQLPISIEATVKSSLQKPIGYHVSITAGERYETVDDVGNRKLVNANEAVYSQYFDTDVAEHTVELSAGDIDLENNVLYTCAISVAMDSGLSVSETRTFRVLWSEEQYEPNAEISVDTTSLTASIRPYCEDEFGNIIEDVLLSVYRREFDGSFVELIKDVQNTSATFVTDPHPALDYARYRIVARDSKTGGVSFYDVPGYPVNEPAIVLQWDESWTNFDTSNNSWTDEDLATERGDGVWAGSILKLPYNVDISDSNSRDVELVKYIGRKHPVGYYGTQIGQTSNWSVEIPKSDRDTLYMLRKLAVWMGDVYVREPSGSGYWASVSVSFNQNHCEVTIPVTFSITRVEGGV